MEKMTVAELVGAVRNHKGAEFATITTVTIPPMRKTGNPFANVTKRCEMNVCFGFNYESSVRRQQTREDLEADFVAQPRKWGKRLDLKTVEHNGKYYITINPRSVLSVEYFNNGKPIDKADIAPWLQEKTEVSVQGVDAPVVYRNVSADNVKVIKFRGKVCEVC